MSLPATKLLKSEPQAEEFVKKYTEFHDNMWTNEDKWTIKLLEKGMQAMDVEVEWDGDKTKGLGKVVKGWQPLQGSILSHRTMEFDIHKFSPTMVNFDYHILVETHDHKEVFFTTNVTLDIDREGKVKKELYAATPKYTKIISGIFESFKKKTSIQADVNANVSLYT